MNLEEEAKKRQERLKNLKRKKDISDALDGEQGNEGTKAHELPKPKFRSHVPKDEKLKENVLERVKPESVEDMIQEHLQTAQPEPVIKEVDLINLAPRKPDWDLKRDISKKLEKLERRTKRAIAEIIRERMSEEERVDVLADPTISAPPDEPADDDDDET